VTRNLESNRFQAMEEALRLISSNGFMPKTIIDAGANVGEWTLMAREIFPGALFHLVEPQSGCAPALRTIAEESDRIRFHPVAVTRPGIRRVSMAGGGPSRRATGAWVLEANDSSPPSDQTCEATTLDDLFRDGVREPVLLKLDLEGHEMAALLGGEELLRSTEVVVTELSLFDINDSRRPVFSEMLIFLLDRGFELYDLASLSARPRDGRLRQADGVFVRRESPLFGDCSWD
jgi:FkbM family methyltransferase